MQNRKTILIDLDGVLNNYTGQYEQNFIPEIKEGAKDFIIKLSRDFDIKLFTTRNKIMACKWIIKYGLESYISDITNVKELAWLYIDDRCLKFEGDFSLLAGQIKTFKTWYG